MMNREGSRPLRTWLQLRGIATGARERARVKVISDLAVWLLNANPNDHWDRGTIIDAVRKGDQKRVELAKPIPVVWIYADAWASADGTAHYRPDVYSLDSGEESHQTRQ
jgi:L,D-transpeptidase YcbB